MWFDVGSNPTNDLPTGLLFSLPPWNERVAWLSGTFSGLSAIPAHYLITSSLQASGLFFCQTDKQFLVQFEIPFAVCCSHGTTPLQQTFLAWPNRNCIYIYIITTLHSFPLWRDNSLLNFKVVYWLRETAKHQITEGRAAICTKHYLSM